MVTDTLDRVKIIFALAAVEFRKKYKQHDTEPKRQAFSLTPKPQETHKDNILI